MPQGYVVAQLNEAKQPIAFFQTNGFVEIMSDAYFFSDKNGARSEYGRAVASRPQNDYAVLPVNLTITLA